MDRTSAFPPQGIHVPAERTSGPGYWGLGGQSLRFFQSSTVWDFIREAYYPSAWGDSPLPVFLILLEW